MKILQFIFSSSTREDEFWGVMHHAHLGGEAGCILFVSPSILLALNRDQ